MDGIRWKGSGWWWKAPISIVITVVGLVLLWDVLHGSPILSDALHGFAQRTDNPDCASSVTKATVAEIAQQNPPQQLLDVAMVGSPAAKQSDIRFGTEDNLCRKIIQEDWAKVVFDKWHADPIGTPWRCIRLLGTDRQAYLDCNTLQENFQDKSNACFDHVRSERIEEKNQAIATASYTLDIIRLTAKDATTGSISCAADLNVDVPNDWGSAKEPITYKVENTSDGKPYVTVFGLQ